MSDFLKQQVEKRLKELRHNCELQRLHVRNATEKRWALAGRAKSDVPDSYDKYWDDLQASEKAKRENDLQVADKELAGFISEHRPLMGADWPGTDHGRLCWAPFLGGCPIDQHYCQKAEGHNGNHGNHLGEWPQSVTNTHEWHKLLKTLPEGSTGLEQSPPHAQEQGLPL